MHPPSDLSTARVIVTGAGAGLGRAYCLDLANAGVGGLLVNDINGKNAEAVASEIRILSPKTKVGVNTSSIAPESGGAPDGAAKIVEDCMRYLGGPPTGLVNNAGVSEQRRSGDERRWSCRL
ncbi:unnamed protein product [Amoebophrya sp. A120]|nr:unnamed protein product [Amoebophrya sp. A120]|eukprot:GSA120T00014934001.1